VAGLSLYVRPMAYAKAYRLEAYAKANFDISGMEAGNFYEIKSNDLVIFAEKVDQPENRAEAVFIRVQDGNMLQVIFANKVYHRYDERTGKQALLLHDGYMYEFARRGEKGKISQFQEATYFLEPKEIIPTKYKRRAASSLHLAGSDKPEDIAELQWRFSTLFSTIFLALLGVPISRTTPRQGKYAKVLIAVVIFAVYYNIIAVAKNWVEKGLISAIPGIWWVQVLLAGLLLVLLLRTGEVFRRQH